MLGPRSLPPTLGLLTTIGIGLSVVSLAAWIAWLSGSGMDGAAVLVLVAGIGAVVARMAWRKGAGSLERPSRFDFGAGVLAAIATVCAVFTGPWLSQSADTFLHLAGAQELLRERGALPQDVFFGGTVPYPDVTGGSLHLVLAWLSLAGGLIPAWTALAYFGAAFSIACVAGFAREITRSTPAALIATAIYLVLGQNLDMRTAGYPNHIAPPLALLAFTFLLRFVRSASPSWRELVPACLLAIAAASVHSGAATLVFVVITTTFATATLVALKARRLPSLGPLAIACGAVMLVTLPLLVVRTLAAVPTPGPEASLASQAQPLQVHVLLGYAFVDPRFWFTGLVSVATVGTLCLFGRARRLLLDGDPGAAMLWGGSLVVPAIMATPLLANWPTGLYFLARVAVLLSLLPYLAFGLELSALQSLATKLRMHPRPTPESISLVAGLLLASATVYLLAYQLPTGVLATYFGSWSGSVTSSRNNNLTVGWSDRLQALEAAGQGTILADPTLSYELAGLTGRIVVAVPFTHRTYQDEARDGALRRGDVADALNPSTDPTALPSVLIKYHVTFVMVDLKADGQASWDWMAAQKSLTPVAGGSGWRLYRFSESRLDQALDIPLAGGVGMSPTRLIAGRAVFVRVMSSGTSGVAEVTASGLSTGASYHTQVTLSDQAGATVTAPLLLPDSARVDRYAVTVHVPGSGPTQVGQVVVGHAFEAEYFAGVVFDLGQGYARQPGWQSVDNRAYARGEAVRALRVGSVAGRPLTDAPGDYCLSVLVYAGSGGGEKTLDVGLGGTTVTETWSDQSRGSLDLEAAAHAGTGARLTYWVPAGAPVGVIVDRITLYPPPAAGGVCGAP